MANREELKKEALFIFTRKHKIAHLEYDLSNLVDTILEHIDEDAYERGYDAGYDQGEDDAIRGQDEEDSIYTEGYCEGYDDRDRNLPKQY